MTFSTRLPCGRRALRFVLRGIGLLLLAAVLGGLVGQILRDRVPVVALLMYVPLLPVGLAATAWDSIARGRTLPKARFALGGLGVVAASVGVFTMLGSGATNAPASAGAEGLTVLHWNVRWGGGGGGVDGKLEQWDSPCRDIARHVPDIVILSESAGDDLLPHLRDVLGPEWSWVRSEDQPGARYLYRLTVLAPWPVRMERESAIPTGRIMQAVVEATGGDVRVLVVDGESPAWLDRTPRLRAVAQTCREAAASGRPIDVIAGDFNAVGRSVGFDDIAEAGFASAGASSSGWRATWPSFCPLYDIDHIWVNRGWSIARVDRFTNLVTDHRGQLARIERIGTVRYE